MLPNSNIPQMCEGGGGDFFFGVDGSAVEGVGAGKNQCNILCYSVLHQKSIWHHQVTFLLPDGVALSFLKNADVSKNNKFIKLNVFHCKISNNNLYISQFSCP